MKNDPRLGNFNTPNVKVHMRGPIFKDARGNLNRGVKTGLQQLGKEMVDDVKSQLYPGHGKITGFLRKSVTFRVASKWDDPTLVLDTSKRHPGQNVIYTGWIERGRRGYNFKGYHMFRNTARKFRKSGRVSKWMMNDITKALGK